MRLSQGQLNLLETCPRKFQHTYLEQLASPTTPDQQERLILGSRFHLLMQQREMGLPIEPFIQEDDQLRQWFTAFVGAAPKILSLSEASPALRQSEHQRTLEFEGHLITVVYDLLILTEQQAQILDWKTYPKPQKSGRLAENWQTRLYPFVMAETSHYQPEQISITYWFFQSRDADQTEPQSLRFAYDSAQHRKIRHDLTRLLQQLTGWLDLYKTTGEPFPQIPQTPTCDDCGFALRCQRAVDSTGGTIDATKFPDLADIEEIPL